MKGLSRVHPAYAAVLAHHSDMDSEALSQFVSVTGATPDAAQFFLESSNGDVAAAIDQYFTSGGQAQQEEHVPAPAARQQAAAATAITPQSTAAAATAPSGNKPNTGTSVDQLPGLNLGICQDISTAFV